MPQLKPIEIFRAGRHTAMSGDEIEFSDHDLRAVAQAYDPNLWQAPLVVGHPKIDAPAYGWVATLGYDNERLAAVPERIDAAFFALVREGRYKNVSASFYLPAAPSNPVPGSYYLRHVGFLGATPPAVRGLKPVIGFAAADEADILTIEFAAPSAWSVARIMRNLRDWMIGKDGLEQADAVIPAYAVEEIESAARGESSPEVATDSPMYAAPQGDEMSDTDRARLTELEAENKRLIEDAVARGKAERTARHQNHAAFAEALVAAGQLPPTHRGVVVGCLDILADHTEAVSFAEGEAAQQPVEAFRAFLGALPKQLDTREYAAGQGDSALTASFATPAGYQVDADSAELYIKAKAYQRAHPTIDFAAAVIAVSA